MKQSSEQAQVSQTTVGHPGCRHVSSESFFFKKYLYVSTNHLAVNVLYRWVDFTHLSLNPLSCLRVVLQETQYYCKI